MTTDLQLIIGIIIIAANLEVTRGVRREITTDHPHPRRKEAKKHHRRSRSRSPMGNDYYRSGGGRSEYDTEYSQSRNSSSLKKHRRKRSSRTPSLSPEPLAPKKRTYTTSNVVSAGDIKKERKPEEKRNRDKYPRGEDRGRGGIDSYTSRSSNGSSSNRRREDRR